MKCVHKQIANPTYTGWANDIDFDLRRFVVKGMEIQRMHDLLDMIKGGIWKVSAEAQTLKRKRPLRSPWKSWLKNS